VPGTQSYRTVLLRNCPLRRIRTPCLLRNCPDHEGCHRGCGHSLIARRPALERARSMPFGGISAADQEIQRIDQPTLALLQCAGVRHAQAEALNPFLLPGPHCGSMLAFFTTSLTLSISRFSALPSTSALPPAGSMPAARSCFSAAGEFGSRDRLRGDLVDGRLRHTGAREEPDDGRQSKRATAGSQRATVQSRVSCANQRPACYKRNLVGVCERPFIPIQIDRRKTQHMVCFRERPLKRPLPSSLATSADRKSAARCAGVCQELASAMKRPVPQPPRQGRKILGDEPATTTAKTAAPV
jgi:hypothetical protein